MECHHHARKDKAQKNLDSVMDERPREWSLLSLEVLEPESAAVSGREAMGTARISVESPRLMS